MTSSLVGSEMCIRDRLSFLVAASLRMRPYSFLLQSTQGPRDLISEITVSYTHLTLPTICSV
eukprot:3060339-Prorocentrum_lima.AAC.1